MTLQRDAKLALCKDSALKGTLLTLHLRNAVNVGVCFSYSGKQQAPVLTLWFLGLVR